MVTIYYLLSEEGRRQSLRAGGDGKVVQSVEAASHPTAFKLGTVADDGTAFLAVGCVAAIGGRVSPPDRVPPTCNVYRLPVPGGEILHAVDSSGPPISIGEVDPRSDRPPTLHCGYTFFDAPQPTEALLAWETTRREATSPEKRKAAEADWKAARATYLAEQERRARARAEEWAALPLDQRIEDERIIYPHPERLRDYVPGAVAEVETEIARRKETRLQAEQAERDREEAERLAWIQEHGSERLRLAVKHGIECVAVYRSERIAHDLPGWSEDYPIGDDQKIGQITDSRNPPLAALLALDREPDGVALKWAPLYIHDPDADHADDDGDVQVEGGIYLLVRQFMGRPVYRRAA
jgi:hypothetical protein